jgi:RHS repeat-associated protein
MKIRLLPMSDEHRSQSETQMFINGLLRWETSAVSAVSTQYFYDGMERLVEVVPAAAPSARTVYDDVVIGTKTHARGRVKQTLTRPLGVTGVTALGVPTVKVNGVPPSGRPPGNGEPGGFAQWLDGLAGTAGSPWAEINLEVSRNTSGSTHAASYQRSGPVFVRPSESPAYDVDGNLTQDGWGTYQWDGENRLKSAQMHEVGAPPQVALQRIELVYDAQGRRVAKRLLVKETVDAAGHFTARETSWRLVKEQRFWYDGWNLMLETQKRPNGEWRKLRSYLWGQDLSGSLQGAGGVGGLLGLTVNLGALEGETGVEQSYATLTEVNGNLMGLLDAVSGNLVARWDYDPFGNLVTDWYALGSGVSSAVCPIRFSSKYQDEETGWLYYGYRYYDAVNGRFIGRDPIGERGGTNLYAMVGNDPVNRWDKLGLLVDSPTQTATQAPVAAALAALGVLGQVLSPDIETVRLPEMQRTDYYEAASRAKGAMAVIAATLVLGRAQMKCPCANESQSFSWGDGRSAIGLGTFNSLNPNRHRSPPDPIGKNFAKAYAERIGGGMPKVDNGHTAPHRLWGKPSAANSVLQESRANQNGTVKQSENRIAGYLARPGATQVCYAVIPVYYMNGDIGKGTPYEGTWRPAPFSMAYFVQVDFLGKPSERYMFSSTKLPKLMGLKDNLFATDQIFDLN